MFFSKKKKKEPAVTEIKKTDSYIYIDIGTEKIKLALINNNKKDKEKRISYNEASVSLDDSKSIDAFLNEDWESAAEKAIDELLDDPKYSGIPIHFTRRSGKNIFLRSLLKKPENITGEDLTSKAPIQLEDLYFDASSSFAGEVGGSLIGMASGEFIIRSMNVFGKHKKKIVSFIPSSLSFVNLYRDILKDQGKETHKPAGLFLDIGFTGALFLAVSPDGVLYEKNINVGFFQIAQKLMEKRGLDFQTVKQMLEEETVLDPRRKEEYEVLDEILNQLALQIKKCISYFSADMTFVPVHKTLFIGGGVSRLKNLDKYLKEKLELEIKFISSLDTGAGNEDPAFDTLSGLINGTDPIEINLLRNTQKLNLKFDDENMVFEINKFIKREKKPPVEEQPVEQEDTLRAAARRPQRPGRPGRPRPGLANPSMNFDFLMKFFPGGKETKEQKHEVELTEEEAARKKKNKMIAVGAVFLLLMWGFKGYEYIEKIEKRRKYLITNYLDKQEQLDTLILQQSQVASTFSSEFAKTKKLDKNFWVEKFLYVAEEMSDQIWLSSINLEKGGGKEEQQKLVINGFVRKSTDGHLRVVANFMGKLISNKNFMKDFNDITFDGIQMSAESEMVTFTLVCWYQRNVNILEAIEEDEKEKKGDFPGAAGAMKAVKDHVQILDKVDKEIQGR